MSEQETATPDIPSSRPKRRHWLVVLSFLVLVAAPLALVGWYLWERAQDRYVSYVGFSVRTEELGSAIEMLGGIAQLSGSSSTDPEILYQFIQSQELVGKVDQRLDLRRLWARADPQLDPVYAFHPPGTIEDLVAYWRRMVKVYNDSGSGLLDLEVQAFTAEDAQAIAEAIYDESVQMINRLSAIAREDSTRYAREELDTTVERLKNARETITRFRNDNQIVDPDASISSQMGLLSSLELQLAETLIQLNVLRQTAKESDPRIVAAERQIEVIRALIADEREKIGLGGGRVGSTGSETGSKTGEAGKDRAFADLVGEYERLAVDLRFAEESYTAALAAYDAAVAEARRKTRYLAAHVRPTLAEAPEHPQRIFLFGLSGLFLILTWAILVLAAYALRDRL